MSATLFNKVEEIVVSGGKAQDSLNQALKCAALIAETDTAFIAVYRDEQIQILASYGLSLAVPRQPLRYHGSISDFSTLTVIDDWQSHLMAGGGPFGFRAPWQSVMIIPVSSSSEGVELLLLLAKSGGAAKSDERTRRAVECLATIIGDNFAMINDLTNDVSDWQNYSDSIKFPQYSAREDSAKTSDEALLPKFLDKSLLIRHKTHSKSGISYHTVRSWRASVKDIQIAAIRLLKASPEGGLENYAAQDIVRVVMEIVGSNAFESVTNVPCGNSGSHCLAERIAQATARLLNVPYINVFSQIPASGSSHPRKNATRPRMSLQHVPPGSVLLVDDVATSGSHISEACSILRRAGNAALAIAWIGS